MKTVRWRTALLLCSILIFTAQIAASAATISVNIPDQHTLTDQQYRITVDISENEGFLSAQLELFYNPEVMECIRVVPGEVTRGMLTDTNPKAEGERTSAILSVAGTQVTSQDGNLATFVFEKPKSGDPDFSFALVELRGQSGENIDCEITIEDQYGQVEEPPQPDDGDETDTGDSGHRGGSGSGPSRGGSSIPATGNSGSEEIVIHDPQPVAVSFSDVPDTYWAKSYIDEMVSRQLMQGYPDGTFGPDKDMTRAEFAALLWNMAGQPVHAAALPFDDVPSGAWYTAPLAWAFEHGYIQGTSANTVSPDSTITRQQAMTILHRYAGAPACDAALQSFADAGDVSAYAQTAMSWAVQNRILSGVTETLLEPAGNATRAQLAAITIRYLTEYTKMEG